MMSKMQTPQFRAFAFLHHSPQEAGSLLYVDMLNWLELSPSEQNSCYLMVQEGGEDPVTCLTLNHLGPLVEVTRRPLRSGSHGKQ